MPFATAVAIGGSGLLNYFGSQDASRAGAKAAKAQIKEARRQYDQTRADFEPFRQTGLAGNSRLAYLLGLSPSQSAGGSTAPLTADQLRQELLKDFTTTERVANYRSPGQARNGDPITYKTTNSIDEAGLNAAIQQRLAQQTQQQEAERAAAAGDPNYGSLLKKFSAEDLEADPVYQSGLKFGLDQGTGAINSRASALGQYDSGATLKALTRYANDYGSTKANESYNRYNNDNTNIYNRLAGISGAGQTATNQVAAAGANASNQIGGALSDMGNARAAGIVGGANAWGNALTSGANAYQNQQFLNMLRGGSGQGFTPSYGAWSGGNYQVD